MKKEQIFIGDISRCTFYKPYYYFEEGGLLAGITSGVEFDSKSFKKNAVLIRLENGYYLDVECLNSVLDYLKLCKDKIVLGSQWYPLGIGKLSGLLMSTQPDATGALFVEKSSIEPYYNNIKKMGRVSARQLKKQLEHVNFMKRVTKE